MHVWAVVLRRKMKKKSFDRSYERDVAGEKALQDGDHYKFWHYKFYGYIKL